MDHVIIGKLIAVVKEMECSSWAGLGHVTIPEGDVVESITPHGPKGITKDYLNQNCSCFYLVCFLKLWILLEERVLWLQKFINCCFNNMLIKTK